MSALVRPGARATVRVPATSANLGPGFDALGLALGLHDEVEVEAVGAGVEVHVQGQGAGSVPLDATHLVARAVQAGLAAAGATVPGLRLSCRNAVPHGRGLGSSAAAVVAGLVAARGLLDDPAPLDDATVLRLATAFEGHPDNAAAAVYGGFTISWKEPEVAVPATDGPGRAGAGGAPLPRASAVRVVPDARLRVVACVPAVELSTATARALLPEHVPHGDAAFNVGRSALLVEAVAHRPDLLFVATDDRLHQAQRAGAMPASAGLIRALRADDLAAVVSGAGPTVLVLGTDDPQHGPLEKRVRRVLADDGGADVSWQVMALPVDVGGAVVTQG